MKIYKDVFHPGLFFSSIIFAKWIESLALHNKKVLDLGTGSGFIGLFAATRGSAVTAIDISSKAVENAKFNAANNDLPVKVIKSDMFSNVQDTFDYVFINPPFYPNKTTTDYSKAWNCGENFEYFNDLFAQVKERPKGEKYFMLLSQDCNMAEIKRLATQNSLSLTEVHSKKNLWERNYIFELDRVRQS